MTDKLPDVWTIRDYPVLVEVTRRIDQGERGFTSEQVADAIGMSYEDAWLAAQALKRQGLVDRRDRGCAKDVFRRA